MKDERIFKHQVVRFGSLPDFLETGKQLPIPAKFSREPASWYGNESPELCFSRRFVGDPSLVPDATTFLSGIDRLQQLSVNMADWVPSPFGAYPMVEDYLNGSPEPMRRKQWVERDTSALKIVVNGTSSAGIDAKLLARRGLVIAAFTMALGAVRPVELWQVIDGDGRLGFSAVLWPLATSPLDLALTCWALSSQRLARGFGYDFIGWSNGFTGGWPWGKHNHLSTIPRLYEVLNLNPEDIYIPSVHLDDKIIQQPKLWLEEVLEKHLPSRGDI